MSENNLNIPNLDIRDDNESVLKEDVIDSLDKPKIKEVGIKLDPESFNKKYITIMMLYSSGCYEECLELLKKLDFSELPDELDKQINSLEIVYYLCWLYYETDRDKIIECINNILNTKENTEFDNVNDVASKVLCYKYDKKEIDVELLNEFGFKYEKDCSYPENDNTHLMYVDNNTAQKVGALKPSTRIDIARANLLNGKTGVRKMLDELITENLTDEERAFVCGLMIRAATIRNDYEYGIKGINILLKSNNSNYTYKTMRYFDFIIDFIEYCVNCEYPIKDVFLSLYDSVKDTRLGLKLITTFQNSIFKFKPEEYNKMIKDCLAKYSNIVPADDPFLGILNSIALRRDF